MLTATLTPADVRQAIAAVSVYGVDLSNDRPVADRLAALAGDLPRVELFDLLTAAGLEGIRRGDGKADMLARLHRRLTARVRARERAEV